MKSVPFFSYNEYDVTIEVAFLSLQALWFDTIELSYW